MVSIPTSYEIELEIESRARTPAVLTDVFPGFTQLLHKRWDVTLKYTSLITATSF